MSRNNKRFNEAVIVKRSSFFLKIKLIFGWIVSTGILLTLVTAMYKNYFGNLVLEFVQPLERGYEFQFKNDTPSDHLVKKFRINIPLPQKVVYKTTQDIYVGVDSKGNYVLPNGNMSYVPAYEFKELDGQIVAANSVLKFKVPPLSSRSWVVPEASIVDIDYELEAENSLLLKLEKVFSTIGLCLPKHNIRYLVVGNYWSVTHSKSLDEALRIACRDDDSYDKLGVCNPITK
jgi:hypothetical protein